MGQRAGLVAQVHLLADLHPEAVEQLQGGPGHLVPGLAHQELEQRLHQVEVGGHHVLDPGAQHLDRHLAPVVQPGPVDDGDGGPADRLGIEVGERVAQRHPEVVLDPLAHLGERHRRSGVEAGPELVGHLVAEHAGGRGDDLAELHERAAEVLEGLAERTGELGRRQRAVAEVRSWRRASGVKWSPPPWRWCGPAAGARVTSGSGRRRGWIRGTSSVSGAGECAGPPRGCGIRRTLRRCVRRAGVTWSG